MKILTVLGAIMLPLPLIASIHGMNSQFMPELQSPYGYHAVVGFMAFTAMGVSVFFQWKNRF